VGTSAAGPSPRQRGRARAPQWINESRCPPISRGKWSARTTSHQPRHRGGVQLGGISLHDRHRFRGGLNGLAWNCAHSAPVMLFINGLRVFKSARPAMGWTVHAGAPLTRGALANACQPPAMAVVVPSTIRAPIRGQSTSPSLCCGLLVSTPSPTPTPPAFGATTAGTPRARRPLILLRIGWWLVNHHLGRTWNEPLQSPAEKIIWPPAGHRCCGAEQRRHGLQRVTAMGGVVLQGAVEVHKVQRRTGAGIHT